MSSGAGAGQGGSSAARGELPPVRSGAAVAGQGGSSFQQPAVDATVIQIDSNKQKFTVIQPSVPEMPGNTLPYPTADIRRE